MLRKTVTLAAEVTFVSVDTFLAYTAGSLFTQDVLGALCSLDQALFTLGWRRPALLFYTFQHVLGARVVQRMLESVSAGLVSCCGSSGVDAVLLFQTFPYWQDSIFADSWIGQIFAWLGSHVVPRRIQRIALGALSSRASRADRDSACALAKHVRERLAPRGLLWCTVAENAVTDLACLLWDQGQWVRVYREEVWRKPRDQRVMRLRRTVKSHFASTALSLVEVVLHLSARVAGKAMSVKLLSRIAPDVSHSMMFWGENVVLCLSAPLLERIAHRCAAFAFQCAESLLPTTEDEAAVDAEEAERIHDDEAEERELHCVGQTKTDLYGVLGVSAAASEAEIKKAYRVLALKHHPDRVSHMSETERQRSQKEMACINEAYEVLSSETKRVAYDASRSSVAAAAAAVGNPMASFDPEHPPGVVQSLIRLPFPVQLVVAGTTVVGVSWVGGLVLYGHIKSHFSMLTAQGRTPLRTVCQIHGGA